MKNEENTLFVWRAKSIASESYLSKTKCPCCKTAVNHSRNHHPHYGDDLYKCPLCGWYFSHVGAAVDWNVRRAYLVTTSDFSSIARLKAIDYKKRGYEIDLIAASDMLRLLEVYNEALPPLDKISEETRRSIIGFNSSRALIALRYNIDRSEIDRNE